MTTLRPAEISNLALWLDAGAVQNVGNGGPVPRWPDRSANGYDAVHKAAIAQPDGKQFRHKPPTLNRAAVNGLPAVRFDANERQTLILGPGGTALDQNVAGFTITTVVAVELPADGRYLFITHNGNNDTRLSLIVNGNGGIRTKVRPKGGGDSVDFASNSSVFGPGRFHVFTLSVDYDRGHTFYRVDAHMPLFQTANGKKSPFTYCAKRTENLASTFVALASTTADNHLSCQIAEVVCYRRALTAEQVAPLEAYLMRKYAIGA